MKDLFRYIRGFLAFAMLGAALVPIAGCGGQGEDGEVVDETEESLEDPYPEDYDPNAG